VYGAQLPTDAEVKAFATKHGPKNLVVLTTTDTLKRPGWWSHSKPTWNFKGKWLVDKNGERYETSDKTVLEDIASLV